VDDSSIIDRITALVAEEQRLQEQPDHTKDARERLREVEVTLDRLWDLLRQRRSREEFGLNPDEAHARDAGTVEGYIQ